MISIVVGTGENIPDFPLQEFKVRAKNSEPSSARQIYSL